MRKIHDEDEENADYGRVPMYQALKYGKEVGKLYVSAIFDCYDLMPNGLVMADHKNLLGDRRYSTSCKTA